MSLKKITRAQISYPSRRVTLVYPEIAAQQNLI